MVSAGLPNPYWFSSGFCQKTIAFKGLLKIAVSHQRACLACGRCMKLQVNCGGRDGEPAVCGPGPGNVKRCFLDLVHSKIALNLEKREEIP